MKKIVPLLWVVCLFGCTNDVKIRLPNTIVEAGYMLDSIYREDQKHRLLITETRNKYGAKSLEMKELWSSIVETDQSNLKVVRHSLDNFGWLSDEEAGVNGNLAQFLVIQHADVEVRTHYLPLMREAVKNDNARLIDLALVEDRTALDQKKPQIYGSQISRDPFTNEYYVSPLINPDSVDVRRGKVGLQPLKDYLNHWDLNWNVGQYKKKLPYYYLLHQMELTY